MEERCELDAKEKLKSDQESSLLSGNNSQSGTGASLAESEYQRFQELLGYFKERQAQFGRMLKNINDIARNLGNPKLSNQEFERLYLEFTNNEIKIDSKLWLGIYLDRQKDLKFIESIKNRQIPDIPVIEIRGGGSNHNFLGKFLDDSLPNYGDKLYLNFGINPLKISNGMHSILNAIPRVLTQFGLISVQLSQEEFTDIFIAFSSCTEVSLSYSIIESDSEGDFSKIQRSNLKILHLYFCGNKKYSNWEAYPDRFINIIKGISNGTPIKNSLSLLNIMQCYIKKGDADKIMAEYDVQNIQVNCSF